MRYIVLFLILLAPQLTLGATITGTAYDLELSPVESIVSLDTEPEQRVVAVDGTYSFEAPPGEYLLVAVAEVEGEDYEAFENITVVDDGSYTVDLILAPSFLDLEELDLEDQPEELEEFDGSVILWSLFFIVLVVVLILIYLAKRRPKSEDDEYRSAVLRVLKKHKGRATQKDLRKELPFSEAKASLVISELESEGKVKKIKKGRGNIIVLQK